MTDPTAELPYDPTAPAVDPALLDAAVAYARGAGAFTQQWFRRSDLAVHAKADGTPVTVADRGAERLLREAIGASHPDDSIVGEEEAPVEGTSGRTWYLDPIDGTKAFTHGVPLYSNLVAVFDEHGPAVGVINLPGVGQTVYAGRGLGCFLDGERCSVSTRPGLDGAYATTSGLDYWPHDLLRRVLDSPAKLRTWGDGYGYALVATGFVDAMIDPIAELYDVAAMPVILGEAGGRFSDTDGVARATGRCGIATNGLIHDEILALLRG